MNTLRWLGRIRAIAGAGLIVAISHSAAGASEAADFFKDKRLKIHIGYGPGGTFDFYARTLGKYMVRHLPGNPTFVNTNMPGASSAKLATYLHGAAPRDGTEFGVVNPSLLLMPVLYEKSTLNFNPAELTVLGSVAKSSPLLVAWHTTGIQTLADLKTKELVIAATSRTGDTFIIPQAVKNVLGLQLKIITGYPGTREALIALESGEVSGRVWTYDSIKATRPNWLSEGQLKIVALLALKPHPDLPRVPLAIDQAPTQADKDALEIVFMSNEFARPFVAPPGLPRDRVKALRDAFDATMRDPEFIEETVKLRLDLNPMSADEMEKLLKKAYAAPPALVKRVREAISD